MTAGTALPGSRNAEHPGQHDPHVLVVGAGRSGTTWVARTLGFTAGYVIVSEPDNPADAPFAARAAAGIGMLPAVDARQGATTEYEALWDTAFGVRRRSPIHRVAKRVYAQVPEREKWAVLAPDAATKSLKLRFAMRFAQPTYTRSDAPRRVVKSIFVPLCLDWLVARVEPSVVLVRRHPLDVVASRLGLGFLDQALTYIDEASVAERVERWGAPERPPADDRFANLVWLVGFEMSAYDDVAGAHPEFHVVDHEGLCTDPVPQFRRLVSDLGLEWSDECERYLRASETPGTGFETNRVSRQQSGKWRYALSDEQREVARGILARFPIKQRYADLQF